MQLEKDASNGRLRIWISIPADCRPIVKRHNNTGLGTSGYCSVYFRLGKRPGLTIWGERRL
jgi:hypothetical protein